MTMNRDLGDTLTALKHSLQAAREFIGPWDQFYDGVAVPHCRAAIGQPAASPRLERCIESAAHHLYGEPGGVVVGASFSYVPEHGFWHGSGRVGGRIAVCFYFEGEGLGLVGFLDSAHAELRLARVSVDAVPARPRRDDAWIAATFN